LKKTLKSGIFLECPNKKKAAEEEVAPRNVARSRRVLKLALIVCTYSKRIGDAPPPPTADTHGPVVEKPGSEKELQPA